MYRNTAIFTVTSMRTSQLKFKVRSIFRHLYTTYKKRQAPISSVMSVRLSVCLSACISAAPSGRSLVKFDIQYLWKSAEKIQIWLKSNRRIGRYEGRSEYVYIVDSSKICFAAWQQYKGNRFSRFHGPTLSGSLLLTTTCRLTKIQKQSVIAFSRSNDYADAPHCEYYTHCTLYNLLSMHYIYKKMYLKITFF
jgi:hypothetical protein